MMRLITIITVITLALCGCSAGGGILPENNHPSVSPAVRLPQENRWTWDIGLYRMSEDHRKFERLPARNADYHYNVNTLVEPPACGNCLAISNPVLQGDGTIKVAVTLKHPFPGHPEYTGFDVRGTIMFPATRYWEYKYGELASPGPPWYWIFEDNLPLYFSRSEDGGGQLLNADGFTYYLWPGLYMGPKFEAPIFNYSKGQYAQGPDPDSTVNGYKLFTYDIAGRRMFLSTDTISRNYHIAPPKGEFTFGYVVDASWAPPTKTPVTEPASDFPFWANAGDGYVLEAKQVAPFKTGTYTKDGPLYCYKISQGKVTLYKEIVPLTLVSRLLCPDIIAWPHYEGDMAVAYGDVDSFPCPDGIYTTSEGIAAGTYQAPPGKYLALWCGWYNLSAYYPGTIPTQFQTPLYFAFIDLEVVDGGG